LKEFSDKVNAADKENIEKKIAQLKEDLKGADVEKIKKSTEELTQASHKLAEAVYKAQAEQRQGTQQAQQGAQQAQQGESAKDDKKKEDVVDAEYKVEDENK